MTGKNDILYMKGDRDVEVSHWDVTLGDILSFECTNQQILNRIKTIKIVKMKETGEKRCVISVLKIISCIHQEYPELQIENLGETDIIVTFEKQNAAGGTAHFMKAAAVCLIVFVGAAFSIMTFNNDVSVTRLFAQINEIVTGSSGNGFSTLEISYSIGITVGILTFFNHFGKKRFTVDPTPLEVQMRVYENDIQTTLVENASRKGKEIDVDKTDFFGDNRS